MTLEQLRVLVKVVDAGSFTTAADVLGVQRSHVSRVIAQLEAELGVTLLERTTRRQSVSEAGRAVYERAVGVLAAIEDTVRVTQDMRAQPQGHLRITCGVAFGIAVLSGWVETFLARHPQCTAEIEYASRELDLVHEGFDLAIRAGPLPDSRLAARRLGRFDYGLFASPAYVQRFGLPATPEALSGHRLVVFTGDSARTGAWMLQHPQQREPVRVAGPAQLRVNAGAGVRSALLAGLGIGQLPQPAAAELLADGRLQPVLLPWQPPAVEVFAVYPSNRYLTPKVRAFVDLALELFPDSRAG
ncbi:MAG: LysR family transcriptional regulator [Rubrivivax sp.]|nr:LysR family transcriptional regulator [Rubrivivax sp.]